VRRGRWWAKLCISHNPKAATLKKEAIRKGGLNRRTPRRAARALNETAIRSVQDVQRLLYRVLADTRDGKLDADIARTLGYVAGVSAKVAETADLEARVSQLFEKVTELVIMVKKVNEPQVYR
jgi:hypothetical protein